MGKTWPAGLIRNENTLNQACGNILDNKLTVFKVKDQGNENLKQVEAVQTHNTKVFIEALKKYKINNITTLEPHVVKCAGLQRNANSHNTVHS
jgi:hypothetical protein